VSFEETGIILEATPHITGGDHVLLTIHTERSAADVADSDVGLIFRTQNSDTRVLVRDGETVAISALTVTERAEVISGIPLLMNLPILGGLFRTHRGFVHRGEAGRYHRSGRRGGNRCSQERRSSLPPDAQLDSARFRNTDPGG